MKKQTGWLAVLLVVALLLSLCQAFGFAAADTLTVTQEDSFDLLQPSFLTTGSENVTVLADGSWEASGDFTLSAHFVYDYTVFRYIIQHTEATVPFSVTFLDQPEDGSYSTHAINLYSNWVGPDDFPVGTWKAASSIRAVYEWNIKNSGWKNSGTATIQKVTVHLNGSGTVRFFALRMSKLAVSAQKMGDLNNDKQINSVDARLVAQFISGVPLTDAQKKVADVNADNEVNSLDMRLILQSLVGLETLNHLQTNYHNHTYRCNHAGSAADEAYVQEAINYGYDAVGFTDHVMLPWIDYQNSVRGAYSQSEDYLSSIRALQEKYAGQIDVLLGYECEWNDLFQEYYAYLIEHHLVDYLILGNHYLEFNTTDNRFVTFSGSTDSEAYVKAYAESGIKALNSGLFKVFAHPDYFMSTVTFWNENVEAYARQICETAKQRGVALEINEGCFVNEKPKQMGSELRYRYPYTRFWEIAKEVGNTVVIGVDAHDPSAYQSQFREQALAFAQGLGITITEDLHIEKQTPDPNTPPFMDSPNYSYAFLKPAVAGQNTYGKLTWNFSTASVGDVEGGTSGRGLRFLLSEQPGQTLTMSTTYNRAITKMSVEAAMGSGNNTTLSVSIGGQRILTDQKLTNTNTTYTFDVPNLTGEVLITMKSSVSGKASYIKSVSLTAQ